MSEEEERALLAMLNGGGDGVGGGTQPPWRVGTLNACPTPARGKVWGTNVDVRARSVRPSAHPLPPLLRTIAERVAAAVAGAKAARARAGRRALGLVGAATAAVQQQQPPHGSSSSFSSSSSSSPSSPSSPPPPVRERVVGGNSNSSNQLFRCNGANAIEYRRERGHCLKPHVDDRQLSTDAIATLSLAGAATMTFAPAAGSKQAAAVAAKRGKGARPVRAPLSRRSLQIIMGAARYSWTHEIRNEDLHDDLRVSITFRDSRAPKSAR